jgi:hypothetical protein
MMLGTIITMIQISGVLKVAHSIHKSLLEKLLQSEYWCFSFFSFGSILNRYNQLKRPIVKRRTFYIVLFTDLLWICP